MTTTKLLAVVLLLFATPAYAYIDPGTGSLVIQMLLAVVAGSLFYLRTIIRKIKGLFGSSQQPPDSTPEDRDRAEP